jgi:cytochrome c553
MNTKRWLLAVLTLTLAVPLVAWADDDDDDEEETEGGSGRSTAVSRATPEWQRYSAECGSCHLAFPPSMLPARSWRALLGGLNDHFGQNAELDQATSAKLRTFLEANAGRDVAGPTPLRITSLPWWQHEHHKVSAAVYQRPSITTPANCAACHQGANQGAFGEHQVKIPR